MVALDIGTICVKRFGREAGMRCVIVDIIDKSFVLVTGPKPCLGLSGAGSISNILSRPVID